MASASSPPCAPEPSPPNPWAARLLVVAAAALWSLNGAFVKLLREPNATGLSEPPVDSLLIALYRTLFAGIFLLPLVRPGDVSFRPFMLVMMATFAAMNALFISALGMGSSANAIILQYTAPFWLFLAGLLWLGERADRRGVFTLVLAMLGVAVIVIGAGQDTDETALDAAVIALGAGVTFAGVILCLRLLRDASSQWLTVLNHLAAALVLTPFLVLRPHPTLVQTLFLVLFGVIQMGVPYYMVSRALKRISAQEVGTITLLEPLLNPVWAYLAVGEVPAAATFWGGGLIIAALAWRYLPRISDQ